MDYRAPLGQHPLVYLSDKDALALDPRTGTKLWGYRADHTIVRMVIAPDRVFLLDAFAFVHCVVATTGQLLGRVAAGPTSTAKSGHAAAMICNGEQLFVATTRGVTSLSMDGAVLWKHEAGDSGFAILPGLGILGQVVQPDVNT